MIALGTAQNCKFLLPCDNLYSFQLFAFGVDPLFTFKCLVRQFVLNDIFSHALAHLISYSDWSQFPVGLVCTGLTGFTSTIFSHLYIFCAPVILLLYCWRVAGIPV